MELTLYRFEPSRDTVIGKIYHGDTLICYTLEDKDRGLKDDWELATILSLKIPKQTAIPYGRYEIQITFSNRFQEPLPLLENVKGFQGIRIHSGNKKEDTEGCILVGSTYGTDEVFESRKAFKRIYKLIGEAIANEQVFITIQK